MPRRQEIASHEFESHDISDMGPTVDWAGGGLGQHRGRPRRLPPCPHQGPAAERRRVERDDPMATRAEGYYDEYGLGLGRYNFPQAHVVGHHGVWGAFAFWSPELDAIITGSVNTGRVDRRPLLGAVVRALTD